MTAARDEEHAERGDHERDRSEGRARDVGRDDREDDRRRERAHPPNEEQRRGHERREETKEEPDRQAQVWHTNDMCRNIKTLFNFEPPATSDEVEASALQFVRKLSGFNRPSKANEEAFHLAVERVAAAAQEMLNTLVTTSPPRDREVEAQRAKDRSASRFGGSA